MNIDWIDGKLTFAPQKDELTLRGGGLINTNILKRSLLRLLRPRHLRIQCPDMVDDDFLIGLDLFSLDCRGTPLKKVPQIVRMRSLRKIIVDLKQKELIQWLEGQHLDAEVIVIPQ
ncbi:MAG: hypothetical protein HQL32_12025 [Planctomycetes bacterium]|nr:hypothetical protein [Planctomycetota bacterium]